MRFADLCICITFLFKIEHFTVQIHWIAVQLMTEALAVEAREAVYTLVCLYPYYIIPC